MGIAPEAAIPCTDCIMGRICKVSQPAIGKVRSNEVAVIHFDTVGPMKTKSLGGNYYLVIGIDDYLNYRFIEPVKTKDEVKSVVKQTVNKVLLDTGRQVAMIII